MGQRDGEGVVPEGVKAFLDQIGDFAEDFFGSLTARHVDGTKLDRDDAVRILQECMKKHGIRFAIMEDEVQT